MSQLGTMTRLFLITTYFHLLRRVGGHSTLLWGILHPVCLLSVVGARADIQAWRDETFIKHIFGGLQWVLESGSRPA